MAISQSFVQDTDGLTGTVTDTTTEGEYPSPQVNRVDAANYLLWSKTDEEGVRAFLNPSFGDVLAVMSWDVATAVSGLYEAIFLRIKIYDNDEACVEEQSSGGVITQYATIRYYASTDKVYKCIAASTGNIPTDTDFWEEVPDLSEVIDNTTLEQSILNVNSDKLIDKAIAERFAEAGCACGPEDYQLNNQLIAQKRSAEINFASGNIYEYEKIIAHLNETVASVN